jgi:hypothetical protein
MSSSLIEKLLFESEHVGISDALDAMTEALKVEYSAQIAAFSSILDKTKVHSDIIFEVQTALSKAAPSIRKAVGYDNSVDEFASCLLHNSTARDYREIFEIFRSPERAKHFADLPAGSLLFELCLSVLLYRNGIIYTKGVPFSNYAINFINRTDMTVEFWLKNGIGPIPRKDAIESDVVSIRNAYYRLLSMIMDYRGFEAAVDFVQRSIDPVPLITKFSGLITDGDPKTLLQEYAQKYFGVTTVYTVERVDGTSDHQPVFEATTSLPEGPKVIGRHSSKAGATMRAAEMAVLSLSNHPSGRRRLEEFRRERVAAVSRRPRERVNSVPPAVRTWIEEVRAETGIAGLASLMINAIISPALATGGAPYQGAATNETLSFLGSKLLEAILELMAEDRSLKRLHPVILDRLAALWKIDDIQSRLLGRQVPHGRDRKGDAAQAVLWALFETDAEIVSWMQEQIRPLFLHQDSSAGPVKSWPSAPFVYDPAFSYIQALQEFTQHIDRSMPIYTDVVDVIRPHAPTHESVVRWRDLSARGTGSRTSWSRNMAAHRLLIAMIPIYEKRDGS